MAHRGERVISRKAIAQGMSDVLRFTCMLMRALFVHIAHEIAGAARIRHSLRPLTIEGKEISGKARAQRVARMRIHILGDVSELNTKPSPVFARSACDEAIHATASGEMDCFAEPV